MCGSVGVLFSGCQHHHASLKGPAWPAYWRREWASGKTVCRLLCLEHHIFTLLHHRENLESEYWGVISILQDLKTMLGGKE